MGVVGRLDQYASMLAYEFDETTANNPSITGLGTYYASEFSENVGITTTLTANVFPPYDPVYDEFGGTLFGAGQGRYMRQNTDKSVIVYNEIDEVTGFGNDISFWLLGEQDLASQVNGGGGYYSNGIFTSANITATSGGTATLSFTFDENVLNVIQGSTSYIRLYKNSSQIFEFTRSQGLTTTYSASYNSGDVFYFQTELYVSNDLGINPGIGTIAVTINSSLVYKYTMTSELD
jgi:hypothetical protein